jgi:hypothetical protein
MVVIGHDGVGADIDGEYIRQLLQPGDYPLLTVLVVLSGYGILSPKKGTAYAATYAVIVGGGIEGDELISGAGHRLFLLEK